MKLNSKLYQLVLALFVIALISEADAKPRFKFGISFGTSNLTKLMRAVDDLADCDFMDAYWKIRQVRIFTKIENIPQKDYLHALLRKTEEALIYIPHHKEKLFVSLECLSKAITFLANSYAYQVGYGQDLWIAMKNIELANKITHMSRLNEELLDIAESLLADTLQDLSQCLHNQAFESIQMALQKSIEVIQMGHQMPLQKRIALVIECNNFALNILKQVRTQVRYGDRS